MEFAATRGILETLGCESTPRLTVWNKIDRIEDPVERNALTMRHTPSVTVSALDGEGIDSLLAEVERMVSAQGVLTVLRIPYDRYDLVARLHREYLEKGNSHAGIIVIPEQRYSIGEKIRRLAALVHSATAESMKDYIEFL